MATISPATVASRDDSPFISLSEFALAFYEETRSLPAAAQPDRFFFREHTAELEKIYQFDLQLSRPKLGTPELIESLWAVHHVASLLFDSGTAEGNRAKTRSGSNLHAIIKRLTRVLTEAKAE